MQNKTWGSNWGLHVWKQALCCLSQLPGPYNLHSKMWCLCILRSKTHTSGDTRCPRTVWNVRWPQNKARFYKNQSRKLSQVHLAPIKGKVLAFNPHLHPQSLGGTRKSGMSSSVHTSKWTIKINFPYYFAKAKNQEYSKKPEYETRNDDRFREIMRLMVV